MRILRISCAAIIIPSVALSLGCYASYRRDQAQLREIALCETIASTSEADRAIQLSSWVHRNRGFAKNKEYFCLRRLGPTPIHVLEGGGDCADKSRLLSAMLRELGIRSTLAMCFDERGHPTHTIVDARLADGSRMLLDPIWDLYFPSETPGGYYGLLDLRRDPAILWRRLGAVIARAEPASKIHRYNRAQDVYDRASTFNWEKNALLRSIKSTAMRWMGDRVFAIPRPTPMEEPKLFLALGSLLPALVAAGVWGASRRWGCARRGEGASSLVPAASVLKDPEQARLG